MAHERSPPIWSSGGSTASEASPMTACSRASQVCSMWRRPGLHQDPRPAQEVAPALRLHLVQPRVHLVERQGRVRRNVRAVQRPLNLLQVQAPWAYLASSCKG